MLKLIKKPNLIKQFYLYEINDLVLYIKHYIENVKELKIEELKNILEKFKEESENKQEEQELEK